MTDEEKKEKAKRRAEIIMKEKKKKLDNALELEFNLDKSIFDKMASLGESNCKTLKSE